MKTISTEQAGASNNSIRELLRDRHASREWTHQAPADPTCRTEVLAVLDQAVAERRAVLVDPDSNRRDRYMVIRYWSNKPGAHRLINFTDDPLSGDPDRRTVFIVDLHAPAESCLYVSDVNTMGAGANNEFKYLGQLDKPRSFYKLTLLDGWQAPEHLTPGSSANAASRP